MHAGSGEEATDGDASAVGHVPVEFVATPVLLMALAAFLDAKAALLGQVGGSAETRNQKQTLVLTP